jgi:hypothetical protein
MGQMLGDGCVYPANIPTVAGQLTSAAKTWKGYMEDMPSPCQHPLLGATDEHLAATAGDQYATRHNPFVYFTSITALPDCTRNVVNLEAAGISPDLAAQIDQIISTSCKPTDSYPTCQAAVDPAPDQDRHTESLPAASRARTWPGMKGSSRYSRVPPHRVL